MLSMKKLFPKLLLALNLTLFVPAGSPHDLESHCEEEGVNAEPCAGAVFSEYGPLADVLPYNLTSTEYDDPPFVEVSMIMESVEPEYGEYA